MRLWSGARSVLVTPARPDSLLGPFLLGPASFPAIHALTAVGLRLKLPDLSDFLFAPAFYELAINNLSLWCWYEASTNPTLQGPAVHSDLLRRFRNRVAFHMYNAAVPHLSSKKRTRTGASSGAPIRVNESITQNVLQWRRSLSGFSYFDASCVVLSTIPDTFR